MLKICIFIWSFVFRFSLQCRFLFPLFKYSGENHLLSVLFTYTRLNPRWMKDLNIKEITKEQQQQQQTPWGGQVGG